MKITEKMDEMFLSHVSDIFANINAQISLVDIIILCKKYAVQYNVNIPIYKISDLDEIVETVGINKKHKALFDNLCSFNAVQQFNIIKDLCELDNFWDYEHADILKHNLYVRYGHLSDDAISKTELVKKTKHWLQQYPSALKQYNNSLDKYERGTFERIVLDEMRLSFELLLKELLSNKKSLENQWDELGKQLKAKTVSPELRNMIEKIFDYYMKYQNTYVKHDDNINSNEIEYIIELSCVMMKFLIQIFGTKVI